MSASAFRGHFPALAQRVHLASCSLGARSAGLDEAIHRMLDDMATGGAPWGLFEEQVFEARRRFARLIGAEADQVAVVPNASIGAYQVASTTDWSARPKIVTTPLEFPSVAHVWLAQQPRGAEVAYAERYEELVDGRTGLVSVPMTTYQDARRMPVADVARLAHDAGAKVFVDAYQAVGNEPVDVGRLGCDYLVAGTMKYLLGLPGLAFLYVRDPESVTANRASPAGSAGPTRSRSTRARSTSPPRRRGSRRARRRCRRPTPRTPGCASSASSTSPRCGSTCSGCRITRSNASRRRANGCGCCPATFAARTSACSTPTRPGSRKALRSGASRSARAVR